MAVEVRHRPKKLHRHAVPVLILSAMLLILSGLAFSRYGAFDAQQSNALLAGFRPTVKIQPKSNGLAKVSGNSSQPQSFDESVGSLPGEQLSKVGHTTELQLSAQAMGENFSR